MKKELHINFGSNTDSGSVKEFNTDAVLEFNILNGHVFVVCDGHNGDAGHGALASKLIAENIKKYFYNRSYKDIAKALTNAITFANLALFEQSQKDEKYNGIASTLAIVIYKDGDLYYAYAGDSRIYLYRNNQLKALTRDHVADPSNSPGSEVTVLIGKSKDIKFGVCKTPLNVIENDIYMLCSDGLTDELTEDEIAGVIGDLDKAPEHKCKNLIELAKEKGGNDCISVQILDFSQVMELQKPKIKINIKPILYGLLGFIGIALLGYGGYRAFEAFKNRPTKIEVEEPQIINAKKEEIAPKANIQVPQKKEIIEKNVSKVTTNHDQVYHNHVIKYGENLYRLALKYNTTQKLLIEINGKKATNLVAGTKLKIPIQNTHKVKSGESFSSISNKYNVKIKLICSASDIDEGTPLKEGQVLVIPLSGH